MVVIEKFLSVCFSRPVVLIMAVLTAPFALVIVVWLIKPSLIWSVENRVFDFIAQKSQTVPILAGFSPRPIIVLPGEMPVPPWAPYKADKFAVFSIRIGHHYYENLQQAASALKDGETLVVGEGIYKQAIVIKANNVTLVGEGHVILEGESAQGKGAIIVDGSNVTISNIECRGISVPDGNGACIRHQGKDLTVEHVYFHDSQQGILTGSSPGLVKISDSRFEKLGHGGRAHGIYICGGSLLIEKSIFLQSKDEGHEIKSRSKETRIFDTLIASLDGRDSRLIDLPHGGELIIERSVLEQGPNSANNNLIGVGLEGGLHKHQKIVIRDSVIIMERSGANVLLHADKSIPPLISSGNIIIGGDDPDLMGQYIYFKNREAAKIAPFPFLPKIPTGGVTAHF